MSIVTEAQVQQWLEATKLTIDDVDDELESTAKGIVLSSLSSQYDVTTWIDVSTTPKLVQQVISMFIAAWEYNRAYSEDATNSSSYSAWLEKKAYTLLAGINSGANDLPEVPGFSSTNAPSFYPGDYSLDANGCPEEAKFTMNARY